MPKAGYFDVITTLADFALITYAVDPTALAKHLPPDFEPEVFQLKDGRNVAFISVVPFRDLDFRWCALPWPRFAFGQTNYRAYVLHKGERVVWFFGTSLATPFVLIPRYLWKLPWHHAAMKFDTTWEKDVCTRYELKTEGAWGAADVSLVGTDEPAGCMDGFIDDEDMAVILTHPLKGYFQRRDGKIGTYSVWHDRLCMKRGIAKRVHFDLLQHLGLCEADAMPHSVLLQQETEFLIQLPPRACQ